jgi:hypothetical protein
VDWYENFSYAYYEKILRYFSENFRCVRFSDVLRIVNDKPNEKQEKPYLLLRHDIDVDVERALRLSQIEKEYGLTATYMVMLNSPLYALDENTLRQLADIRAAGNELGLHFYRDVQKPLPSIEEELRRDKKRLEDACNCRVAALSFHRPADEYLRGPLLIADMVNAYSKELMAWYISDSRGRFRVGEPMQALAERKGAILQFLTHPLWWGEAHATPEMRVQHFFEARLKSKENAEKKALARTLYNHISVWPANFRED